MLRSIPKLLTVLVVLGCGSGAMASPTSPDHGQWMDSTDHTASSPDPASSGPQAPAPGSPAQAPSSSSWRAQGGYPDQSQSPYPDQQEDTSDAQDTETDQVRLGVMVMPLTPELRQFFGVPGDRGVLIARVEPSSAASRAGLQVGDVLVRVGGRSVQSGDDVIQALAARQGGRLRLAVTRQGRPVQLFATLPGTPRSSNQDQGSRAL